MPEHGTDRVATAAAGAVCIVTGASGTIGAATARLLAERGCTVYAGVRDPDTQSARALGLQCVVVPLDVSSSTSVESAVRLVLLREGRVDVLVNNAAVVQFGPVETMPVSRVAAMLDVNALGPLRTTQAVAPAMRRAGSGLVVQVSSVSGRLVTPLAGAYAASKHALEALSEAAWQELGHFGIRVVVIEPGDVGSGRAPSCEDEDGGPYRELWSQVFADRSRGPRGGSTPQDVAEAVWRAVVGSPADVLRVPVGADARAALAARPTTSDGDFKELAFAMLGVRW